MKIKTIKNRLDNAEAFDRDVNKAIQEGWKLNMRTVLVPTAQPNTGTTYLHMMLYAELVLPDAPQRPNLKEALQAIKDACNESDDCYESCPLYAWCDYSENGIQEAPNEWKRIEEVLE